MMDDKIIKKVTLDIDGVEIGLTPEQAKKLQGALNELLGVEKEKEYIPQPYYVRPYRPYWYDGITWTTLTRNTAAGNVSGCSVWYNQNDGNVKLST